MKHLFYVLLVRMIRASAPILTLIFALASVVHGQQVLWPKDTPADPSQGASNPINMVFQRDVNNKATVRFIVATANNAIANTIQVRFRRYGYTGNYATTYIDPRPGSPNTDAVGNLNGVGFVGLNQSCQVSFNLDISGGMYELEATINGTVATRDFGVGEVFAIAGQSNAAGYAKANGTEANGEATVTNVKFVHYNNTKTYFDGDDPESVNRKYYRYYWGKLGSQLAQSLNVPIAFYQAGWSGTSVTNWYVSSQGQQAYGPYGGSYPFGYPYQNLKTILLTTRFQVGLRAVLWHQGERYDSGTNYNDELDGLIQQSRTDLGGTPLSWVIARASYRYGSVFTPVINSQNRLLTAFGGNIEAKAFGNNATTVYNRTNIFSGPDTDQYTSETGHRTQDNTHFNVNGQNVVADAWFTALTQYYGTQNFFSYNTALLNIQSNTVASPTCTSSSYYLNVANNPNLQTLPSAGGNIGLTLTSNINWTITESLSWASVTPSGSGNGTPVIVFDANTGPTRSGTITISGSNGVASITVTITQQGAGTQPTSGSCYEAESASGNRGVTSDGGASGGAYSGGYGNASEYSQFSVNANSGSNTLTISYSSSENPTLSLIVDGNSQSVNLTSNGHWGSPFSTISVPITFGSGTTHTIRIQGASSGSCSVDKICLGGGTTTPNYYLSTANTGSLQSVSSAGGNLSFAINSNVSWTISESLSWVSVTASGSNNGTPVVTVDQNTGAARSGSLTISGSNGVSSVVLTVSQQASGGTTPTPGSCYEAENASGNRGVTSDGGASGGAYSGGYGNASEYSQFSVNANSGSNTLTISYSSSENPTLSLIVDGNSQSVNLTSNGHWGSPFSTISVPITFGSGTTHTIRIQGASSGAFNLDKICLQSGSGRLGSVEPGTSINELVSISPNPASSTFTVTLQVGLGEKATVKVRNLLGQEMASRSVVGEGRPHVIEFGATTWLGGLYLVNVTVGEQALDKRLVIVR